MSMQVKTAGAPVATSSFSTTSVDHQMGRYRSASVGEGVKLHLTTGPASLDFLFKRAAQPPPKPLTDFKSGGKVPTGKAISTQSSSSSDKARSSISTLTVSELLASGNHETGDGIMQMFNAIHRLCYTPIKGKVQQDINNLVDYITGLNIQKNAGIKEAYISFFKALDSVASNEFSKRMQTVDRLDNVLCYLRIVIKNNEDPTAKLNEVFAMLAHDPSLKTTTIKILTDPLNKDLNKEVLSLIDKNWPKELGENPFTITFTSVNG